MAVHWYSAYGLRISSEVPMATPAPLSQPAQADLVIRLGKVDRSQPRVTGSKSLLGATPQEISCVFDDAGAFSLRNGREIIVDPNPEVDPKILATWLQGTVFSIALHQLGFLVLHASSVSVDGSAVTFMGESGWGKSTMAAALVARGHRLLTDDVVAIRVPAADAGGSPMVVPGFPHLKLKPEAATFLGDDPDAMLEVAGDADKRFRLMHEGFSEAPVPLRAVYVLGEGETCCIEPLDPQAALLQIICHSFVARMTEFLRLTETAQSHFTNCTQLVNMASINRLKRPRSLELLPTLAEMVEQQLTSKAAAG